MLIITDKNIIEVKSDGLEGRRLFEPGELERIDDNGGAAIKSYADALELAHQLKDELYENAR